MLLAVLLVPGRRQVMLLSQSRPTLIRYALTCVAALLIPAASVAQEAPSPPPTVGVVLSGGSAKGLAHIGVLRVLEEHGVPVHVVTGTSMGAIVGGLYAAGYTPSELDEIVREVDWAALFSGVGGSPDPPSADWASGQHVFELPLRNGLPTLPSNIVSGQHVFQLLARLTWRAHGVRDFSKLRVPFAAVAADLETGQAVTLTSGFLPDAIQASMALPAVFEPVKIGGRSFVDGGVVRNLPAQDAIELGASVVICSDVSDPLIPADSIDTALQTMTQVMLFEGDRSNEEQRALCDVVVRMQFARGAGMEFGRAPDLIAFGDSAARASIDEVMAATRGASPHQSEFTPIPDAVNVTKMSVSFDGTPDVAAALGSGLGLGLPDSLTAADLDRALSKAYGSGRFRFVHYRTDSIESAVAPGADRELVVQAERSDRGRLGFGLRYESTYKASLLLTALFHGLGNPTSDLRLDLRLGQQIRLAGAYLYRARPGTAFAAGGTIGFTRMPVDVFDAGQTVAELRFDSYAADGLVGVAFGPRANLAFRIHGEHLLGKTAIAAEAADSISTFYTIGGQFRANWYDREYFPMRGAAIVAKSEFASTAIGSGATFSHHVVDLHGHLPFHRRASVMARATVGGSSGDGLPLNYVFMLGGANPQFIWPDRQFPFFGVENQELKGRAIQRFSVGVRVEPIDRLFASLEWNTYGITLGAGTPFGGIALRLGGLGFTEGPIFQIDFGSRF
jgi:NTE family protein